MNPDAPVKLLAMRRISKTFPGVKALSDVDFEVWRGEVVALVGENGAGKSTLMKVLAGAQAADSGEILLDGKPVQIGSTSAAHALGISTIYQELMLVADLSVVENVHLGHLKTTRWGTVDWRGMRASARMILDDLGYRGSLDAPVGNLSVAEQQLVEIAKAITRNCRLLIMDEPTASLNREEVEHFFRIVTRLRASGLSVVFITHHLNEIFEICERVVVLRDGIRVGEARVSDLTETALVEMMLGHNIEGSNVGVAREEHAFGEVLLRVTGLSTPSLLKDVSFELRRGEVLGLAGLMGSGRSEILRTIYGADKAARGTIEVHGKTALLANPRAALAAGIGLGPENRKTDGLVLSMPIRYNATMSSIRKYAGPFALLRRKEEERVKTLCETLRVKFSSTEVNVGTLSGGNQQKVILARLLDADVDIFLLDEPTRGIDIGAKDAIFRLVRDLAEQGKAVIFVSSVIEEVLHVSDRVICLNLGRVTGAQKRGAYSMPEIMVRVMGGQAQASHAGAIVR